MRRQFEAKAEPGDLLDARTGKNVRNIMSLIRNEDWDWLAVADGDERIGKTTLLILVLLTAEPPLNRAILTGEFHKVLERVAWSFDGMMELVKTLPDGTAHIYDEASMLGREALREHNLRMVRVMSTIGIRNRLYLWTFPDFYMLDPYIRDGRVRTRAYVQTMDQRRGYVTWYVRERFPFPRPGGETVWWRKGYASQFPSIPSLGKQHAEFYAVFREREREAKTTILEGGNPDVRREIMHRLREKTDMTIDQIADIVNRSKGVVAIELKGQFSGELAKQNVRHSGPQSKQGGKARETELARAAKKKARFR